MMPRSTVRFAIPIQLLVLLIYNWYFTAGYWTHMPDIFSWDLYDRLANAFAKGQLYLEEKPAADLLALPDPYEIRARKGVSSYIGDATLYQGRYYIYWGPIPAALIAALKVAGYQTKIGDAAIVMVFVSGLFVLLSAFVMILWTQHFKDLPSWSLLATLPVLGLAPPLTWLLNNPLVYEAALAAAAFFFVAGLLSGYMALQQPLLRSGWYLLAGTWWALAIGCQFTQVIAVGGAVALLVLWTARDARWSGARARWVASMAACAPIVVMLIVLAWYNYARFGALLEFGYRYQLAVVDLNDHYNEIFQPVFAIPNAYNYLLNPFRASGSFPFIVPQYGQLLKDLPLRIPSLYYSEAITGLAYSAPILVLALVPVSLALRRLGSGSLRPKRMELLGNSLHWLLSVTVLALIPNLAVLLFFYYSAPRYLSAVMPQLLLLCVIGFWLMYRGLHDHPVRRLAATATGAVLSAWTIIASTLLAVSSSQDRFLEGNPALIESINRLLGGK